MQQTPQQETIIREFKNQSPMAIRAVAGSGKTTTLVMAFQHAPKDSLCVAFNKKNSLDLAERMPSHIVSKTMNALGHAAWQKNLGKTFLKLDTSKLFNLLKSAPFANQIKTEIPDILRLVNVAKSFGISSGYNAPEPDKEVWGNLAEEFDIEDFDYLFPFASWLLKENAVQSFQGLIDFNDQIYMPIMYGTPFQRYSCVAVDEAQDLSELQHRMISKSLAHNGQLIIVGDPNQAIYAWRGASSSSFDDLREKHNLPLFNLTYSFRCPRDIVEEAKKYVPDIEAASSLSGSVSYSDATVLPQKGITVLSRTNANLISLAFQAFRKSIPIHYSGKDFLSGIKALNKKYPTIPALESWRKAELEKTSSQNKISRIEDRFAALVALHETKDVNKAIAEISKTPKEEGLILSTIHKAKGLEWNNVVYLDYFKEKKGEQENNVKYVGVTRAKQNLLLQGERL